MFNLLIVVIIINAVVGFIGLAIVVPSIYVLHKIGQSI